MIMNTKKSLLVITLLLITFSCCAQINMNNLEEKYWFYRERLKYFVINGPGTEQGDCMVADKRTSTLSYGQHATYFGYYLGVLATEYYLLNIYGQDASSTYNELNNALDAYIYQLDMFEEKDATCNKSSNYDGFFIRNSMHSTSSSAFDYLTNHHTNGKTHFEILNEDLCSTEVWTNGISTKPGYATTVEYSNYDHGDPNNDDSAMQYVSQDEIIGLLKGLVLVVGAFSENSAICQKAKDIGTKIILYAYNSSPNNRWEIWDPCTNNKVSHGSSSYSNVYAYPLAQILIDKFDYPDNDVIGPFDASDWATIALNGLFFSATFDDIKNTSMTMNLLALSNTLGSSYGSVESTIIMYDFWGWEAFYVLLWEFSNNTLSFHISNATLFAKAYNILESAPCDGPYSYGTNNGCAPNGWGATYKFEANSEKQNYGDSDYGAYNGLDYLLLYNLFHIRFRYFNPYPSIQLPLYRDMISCIDNKSYPIYTFLGNSGVSPYFGNNSNPYKLNAIKSIESTANIDVWVHDLQNPNQIYSYAEANITYRAGKSIKLKPGFSVKPGSYFHAFIEPFNCSDEMHSKSLTSSNYVGELYTSIGDFILDNKLYTPNWDSLNTGNNNTNSESSHNEPNGIKETKIKAHPNPFTEKFNLEYTINAVTEINISVVSEMGVIQKELILKQTIAGQYIETINCSDLAPGVYYCVIKTKEYCSTIKILKTR